MSQRKRRVEKLSAQVLSEEIARLKDPRIGFVTVTTVRVTPDLHRARVLVSVLGSDEEKDDTMRGLTSASAHLRAQLGTQIRLKFVPELVFELDHAAETAERVESLLARLHSENSNEEA
ncbi:MAG: 30S ribosome-binding factor RbfA [Actinomycetota bacterium]|nr:30S ribosome-binding factor RbfA [Actinomycetota bacterium]